MIMWSWKTLVASAFYLCVVITSCVWFLFDHTDALTKDNRKGVPCIDISIINKIQFEPSTSHDISMPICLLQLGSVNVNDMMSSDAVAHYFPHVTNFSRKHWVPLHCQSKFAHLFQHFFLCLFSFASAKIWQDFFRQDLSRASLDFLDVNQNHYSMEPWTQNLVTVLTPYFGGNFITYEGCRPELDPSVKGVVFIQTNRLPIIHPLDLYRLTSLLLHKDPCRLVNKSEEILSRKQRVTILNRRGSRRISNVQEVIALFLSNQILNNTFNLNLIHFENMNLQKQAAVMEGTDILIAAHGAGLANAVFLSPCSSIIEVVPYGYYGGIEYFSGIFASHFLYHQWVSDCDFHHFTKKCEDLLRHSAYHNISRREQCPLKFQSGGHPLDRTKEGRGCLRSQNIFINVTILFDTLMQVVGEREQCILENRMYRIR